MKFLGIDTSCYKTSLAVVDEYGQLLWEKRVALPVKGGEKGLRQSHALFVHLVAIPHLLEEGQKELNNTPYTAVGAAVKPRPLPDSYMPVFKVAETVGRSIAASSGVPFFPFSHQEGHIAAGIWSSAMAKDNFFCLHVSGGTTELLQIKINRKRQMEIKLIGGTEDLNAGQFIDRLGVEMGFPFPAGIHLEKLAKRAKGSVKLPVAVKETKLSFSGPATRASHLLKQGCPKEELARGIEICIAESLSAIVRAAQREYRLSALLIVGGVAANRFIRRYFEQKIDGLSLYFAPPLFSGDNAVGIAILTFRNFTKKSM
ncbi:MAG: O-sialoglycoprotein endopeptidase [Dethiobacteria bacterium]|jgi:N6-L-threonylcarbamoyladenine synthase